MCLYFDTDVSDENITSMLKVTEQFKKDAVSVGLSIFTRILCYAFLRFRFTVAPWGGVKGGVLLGSIFLQTTISKSATAIG
jgi:hypothetical protein